MKADEDQSSLSRHPIKKSARKKKAPQPPCKRAKLQEDERSLYLCVSMEDTDSVDGALTPHSRPRTPRVVTPRTPEEHSSCHSNMTVDYSIVSLTRPPSFLSKFRKTIEVSCQLCGQSGKETSFYNSGPGS